LTVNRANFKALYELAERNEKMAGAENHRTKFVNGFASGVDRAYKSLIDNKFIKRHGIAQMTTAGAGGDNSYRHFKEWTRPEKAVEEVKTEKPFEERVHRGKDWTKVAEADYDKGKDNKEADRQSNIVDQYRGYASGLQSIVDGKDSRITNPRAIAYAQELLNNLQSGVDKPFKAVPAVPSFKTPKMSFKDLYGEDI